MAKAVTFSVPAAVLPDGVGDRKEGIGAVPLHVELIPAVKGHNLSFDFADVALHDT